MAVDIHDDDLVHCGHLGRPHRLPAARRLRCTGGALEGVNIAHDTDPWATSVAVATQNG